jgi:hypothetical protein
MVENPVDEFSIGDKTGIVPAIDVSARNLVSALIGALPRASGLYIPAVGQQFVPDVTVISHPEAGEVGHASHFPVPR